MKAAIDPGAEYLSKKAHWVQLGENAEIAARQKLISLGYTIVAAQLYVLTPVGLRITDFVVSGGPAGSDLVGYEVKANRVTRSTTQLLKDDSIERVGGE